MNACATSRGCNQQLLLGRCPLACPLGRHGGAGGCESVLMAHSAQPFLPLPAHLSCPLVHQTLGWTLCRLCKPQARRCCAASGTHPASSPHGMHGAPPSAPSPPGRHDGLPHPHHRGWSHSGCCGRHVPHPGHRLGQLCLKRARRAPRALPGWVLAHVGAAQMGVGRTQHSASWPSSAGNERART